MLDEVDAISSVSGGSCTALAYALYGERVFEEYPKRFLYRDVEGCALIVRALLNPVNWVRFSTSDLGRSDVAAAYYDEILFDGATFGDLIGKPTPTGAQTTDISNGARFSFVQSEFDVICSDFSTVKLSHAAAASSAVPLVLLR